MLERDFVEAGQGSPLAVTKRAAAEARAHHYALRAISLTAVGGDSVYSQLTEAHDRHEDMEVPFDEALEGMDGVTKAVQDGQAWEQAAEILAGMVARLLVEQQRAAGA